MSIYKSAVKNPITTALMFVAVIIFGLYSFTKLSIDLYPEMEIPSLTVITTYSGASSVDIETNVTKLIENQLGAVQNVDEVYSTSQDNMSIVTIEFEWGEDLDEATNNVRDVLDRIIDFLPEGTDRPQIYKFNTTMMPIMMYSVSSNESYSGIQKIVDEQVVSPLKRISGVGSVSIAGGPQRVVYVETTPEKLDAYNLTVEQIGNAIRMENLNMPAGNIRMGNEDYQLRVEGEFEESVFMNDIVVGNYNGKSIFLKDVALLRDTIEDLKMESRTNGKQTMMFYITKQSGSNTVQIAEQVKEELEKIQPTLPKDISFNLVFDSSKFIKNAISNLSEAFLYALIFVVLIILVFLGRWRATFIVVITIPVSLIVAFIYLYVTGGTLNLISLSSLSIAIGMVVDDAIVVLENITKHIERGSSPRDSATYGTNEVWLAVIASALVIIAVFFPLTLVGGQMGIMFQQFGYIICLTIIVSTVAAITLTPMMASRLLKLREKDANRSKGGWYEKHIISKLDKLDLFYEKTLRWALNNKKKVILIAFSIFVASLFLLKFIPTTFMTQADQGTATAMIELQRGTRVEVTAQVARKIEAEMKEVFGDNLIYIATTAGANDEGGMTSLFNTTGTNIMNMSFKFVGKTERDVSIEDMGNMMRDVLDKHPEIENYTVTPNGGMMSMSGSNTIDIEIFGYDFNTTNKLAQEIKHSISTIPEARDIQISRKDDKAQLQIEFNREKLAQLGLNSATVSNYIRNRVAGMTASRLRENGDEYDVIVRFKEEGRNTISDIENMTFMTPTGKKVKLSEVGEVKELWMPPSITHKGKERYLTVSVKIDKQDIQALVAEINKKVDGVEKPKDVIISIGGAYEDQMESFGDIGLLMLVAILLVFIVMAAQFESFSKPFVIMFAIPFAFSGVLIALFIAGTHLDVIAAIGAVMLIGIVVKNGIVLVDFINLMRDRGYDVMEAIAIAGKSRLRPVLMTTLTTILGMVPMALSTGDGSEIWKPMAVAVIGGLTFSTVVTLILVPTAYAIMAKRGERDKQKAVREEFKFLN